MDEPLADASAVALYFLSKEAAGHVKVVLSGEGADELFGGYNIYREPESLKKIAWIPFGVRRVIGKLAAKLPDSREICIYYGVSNFIRIYFTPILSIYQCCHRVCR